jgi:hypothetical protein
LQPNRPKTECDNEYYGHDAEEVSSPTFIKQAAEDYGKSVENQFPLQQKNNNFARIQQKDIRQDIHILSNSACYNTVLDHPNSDESDAKNTLHVVASQLLSRMIMKNQF